MTTLLIETGTSPVFLALTCCWPPWLPTVAAGKSSCPVERVSSLWRPKPLRLAVAGLLSPLCLTSSSALREPRSVGVNATRSSQLSPVARTTLVQLSTVTTKSEESCPPIDTPPTSSLSGPSLVRSTC